MSAKPNEENINAEDIIAQYGNENLDDVEAVDIAQLSDANVDISKLLASSEPQVSEKKRADPNKHKSGTNGSTFPVRASTLQEQHEEEKRNEEDEEKYNTKAATDGYVVRVPVSMSVNRKSTLTNNNSSTVPLSSQQSSVTDSSNIHRQSFSLTYQQKKTFLYGPFFFFFIFF
ncbi:hypothetical protein RFI_03437 [Reticulomyxa filosa]|uniref:Uncharacterized protein n=1 Tax=Reticulomyxa filosa TaxID=46433 RepID=X6P539_RETFI|nr:hypothetical protein RFI_03437 [Reticulomyxa filosa]|eukprot:ETO33665.1 hypothetical protein RFI_03437 [Reticulomyxa filosa]